MKPIIKKAISFILTLCLGFSISIPIHASEADETSKISELKGHWAEKTLTEWIRLGLLKGDNHGRYNPDSPITRAEFMALVNRVMNYTVKGDSIRNFTDVSPDKWYYDDASIALAIGYIKGTSATTLSPEDTITREQAITIISRIQGISPDGDTGILALFNDSAKISSWAAGSVAAAIREGLVTGSNGNINPDAQTTRCEAIVLLDRVRTNTRVYAFDSLVPTSTPSQAPTEVPTLAPTATPLPTQAVAPTQAPTQVPGSSPTTPIEVPTASPTKGPTAVPTAAPTAEPTAVPTVTPEPTQTPSPTPTGIPDPASPPTKLTYPEARLSLANGTFYGRRVPVVEGGTPTVFEVSPALPDGISFDPNTGVLCGGNTKPTGISGLKNYTITAKNDAGSASFVIAIEVRPIITFTADPLSILKGDKATLTWNVQKVENIGYPAPVVTISNLGVQPRTGSVEVSPEQTTTYSLSVQSGEEYFPDVKTVTIQVGDDSMLPTPVISVGPSTTVEVGEAVIFDGRGSTDDKPLLGDDCLDNTFVWDYGDGSAVMSENWGHRSGPVSMHYFMKPGTFPVTLTVNDSDGYRASTTVNITVTGTAPMEGFEVLHAPFHSRIAQQILVHLPESVTADSANRMIATLQGPQGETKLLTKSGLSAEEVFLLDHRDLTKGDYVLEVELLNGDGQRLPGGIWREKFTKDYEGLPTVGIDENNAIRVNGELYFPVHNWAMNLASLPDYLSMKAIDGVFYLYTGQKATYSEEHGQWIPDLDVLKSSYQNYLEPNDLFGIVEDKWTGKGITEATLRNSDPNNIREYVASLKNSPSLFAWCWDDEPNLGSWTSGGVPPNVLAAWHHFTSVDDPLHPTLTNLAGYMYCSTSAYTMQKVEYMMKYSDKDLGKKVALADIIHGACFALEAYKSYPDPNDPSRGAIDVYTDYLKNRRDWNYNLLPTMAVTATCNIIPEDKVKYFGPPSPDDIRMITWLNIVYGVKGMNWYPYLGYLPAENFATMGEISQQIDELTPVILGPEEVAGISVSDNANIKGKNVKTMLRETDDAYYLFTVRLTEREWWDDPSIEPEQISATFELAGLSGNKTATEYLNHKKVFEEHGTKEGGTEFTFTLAQKPVPGSVSFGGVIEQDDRPYKKFCYVFDDGNGNLYANKYWKTGGTMPAGTIDYSTGEVTVFFPNMWNSKKELILPGEDCLIASYEPVRAERTVQIQNGTFTDTFNRNDVHIYRIPKN